MSPDGYSLDNIFWCFIGTTLFCAIFSGVLTVAIPLVFLNTGIDGFYFSKVMFISLFTFLNVSAVICTKVA